MRIYHLQHGGTVSAGPPALPDKPSIAVLPFQNMSGDKEQDYFADGMVEDIITGLSRIKWLFVIARNSTFTYKGRSVDIKQVGRELGVRYVLEGSVRKTTGRVRITTQLINAETGGHIWAERYDRAIDDIFALQDEITLSTVAAIEPNLRHAEIERAKRKRPENLDAYDLVLRATPLADTGMPDGASRALPFLEKALSIDPEYALALGQAAFCHEILFIRDGRREENRTAAIRHAHAAIALGPDDAPALVYGGIAIGLVEHDRVLAMEVFESALTISPYEDAATAVRRAIRSKPGFSISHMFLAAVLAKLGRMDEAKAAAERVLQLQPNFSSSGQCVGIGCAPILAAPLIEAMRSAGLPD